MTRTDSMRMQVQRMVGATPFRPFALVMESGDRVIVDHPENIAFDIRESGWEDVSIISDKLRYYTTFAAVSSVALLAGGELTG